MGLAKPTGGSVVPIYSHLYDQGLVEHLEFTLCLGKNGGKFTIGGYDDKLKVHPDLPVTWIPLQKTSKFYITLEAVTIGDRNLTSPPKKAMIDSGTTFSYLSNQQLDEIDTHVQEWCKNNTNDCYGSREKKNCYRFNPSSEVDENGKKLYYRINSNYAYR